MSPRRFRPLFRTAGCVAAELLLGMAQQGSAQAPSGEVTVSFHVTLAPSWFDPSTAPPQITPFGVLGDPAAAKWSFERYQGAGAKQLQSRVRQVEAADPLTVCFQIKEPWPDFMTFYGTTATAAGIVLPRKYFERVAVNYSKGSYAYGGYPDLDELFLQQGRERDPARREALPHRIQQATVDWVMFAPLMDLRGLIAIGPRLAEHTMNVIPMYPFPAYEDMWLKSP